MALLIGPAAEGCGSCAALSQSSPPPRDAAAWTERWALAHAFDANLEGWFVLLPRRHVVALHELTDDESAELGPLLVAASRALRTITDCAKAYVIQLAEAPGFSHVHFHLVPRALDLDPRYRGAKVFGLLGGDGLEVVAPARRDALALELRERLAVDSAIRAADLTICLDHGGGR